MIYQILTTDQFDKAFKKLDKQTQRIIKGWIDKNLIGTINPRQHGKMLKGDKKDQWRYRIGSYRLLAKIEDDKLIILFIDIGHRKNIYIK